MQIFLFHLVQKNAFQFLLYKLLITYISEFSKLINCHWECIYLEKLSVFCLITLTALATQIEYCINHFFLLLVLSVFTEFVWLQYLFKIYCYIPLYLMFWISFPNEISTKLKHQKKQHSVIYWLMLIKHITCIKIYWIYSWCLWYWWYFVLIFCCIDNVSKKYF